MPGTSLRRLAAVSILAVLSFAAGAQTAYRWVDQDGRVHYSDQPPPPEIRKLEHKSFGDNVVDTSGLPYETRRAAENFPVILYATDDCADLCVQAREFLQRRKIPFAEKRLKNNDDLAAFKKTTGIGDLQVPSLAVGSKSARGYLESEWSGLLDAAGYPRSQP
jgi:glutaredoxin